MMVGRIYSERLGQISDEQFQAALDRFHLGRFLQAEPIPFGLFGQNVFVSSTHGDYVLRGKPHFCWQFPTEQFYTRFLYESAHAPAPWPYLIDPTTEIFGWSYVLMPRMPGLQLADPQISEQLSPSDRLAIARALGKNLACMQEAKWPCCGRYQAASGTVEPFELAHELAWPFPVESDPHLAAMPPTLISYSQRVKAYLGHQLAKARALNAVATTQEDLAWVEDCIEEAKVALDDPFEPCIVLEDYKSGNLVVLHQGDEWRVSGVFDLMSAHFGDGEADLSRQYAVYLEEDPRLARAFLQGYLSQSTPRSGFARRFPVYMLLDRAITWEFVHRYDPGWWDRQRTFRDWASKYISLEGMLSPDSKGR
jgi:aminoglycoside phosphotransferase (APT) family kinase protein